MKYHNYFFQSWLFLCLYGNTNQNNLFGHVPTPVKAVAGNVLATGSNATIIQTSSEPLNTATMIQANTVANIYKDLETDYSDLYSADTNVIVVGTRPRTTRGTEVGTRPLPYMGTWPTSAWSFE
jgi:hypothetical protein